MPITTDERTYDMSSWVAEKADSVLSSVCRIVDWFKAVDPEISELDRERIANFLWTLIYDAAKLSSFGHENLNSWSREWVEFMFHHGYEGFLEFQKRASGQLPNDSLPSTKWPPSVQAALNLFDEVVQLLQGEADRALIRGKVIILGNQLKKTHLTHGLSLGDNLLDLVDKQAVSIEITWDDFVEICRGLLEVEWPTFVEEAEQIASYWA